MTEALRFEDKILGATVSWTADRWYVAIQVKVHDAVFYLHRQADGIVGADLGVKSVATLSTGEVIETRLVMAEPWYPSSRLCSVCGWKNDALSLWERWWVGP